MNGHSLNADDAEPKHNLRRSFGTQFSETPTIQMHATAQSVRCQWTLWIGAMASRVWYLRPPRHLVLICGREGANIIRTVTALAERGFAAFAKIPYQDAATQQALAQLMDDVTVVPHHKKNEGAQRGWILPRHK